jgi:hypothetical protein
MQFQGCITERYATLWTPRNYVAHRAMMPNVIAF